MRIIFAYRKIKLEKISNTQKMSKGSLTTILYEYLGTNRIHSQKK